MMGGVVELGARLVTASLAIKLLSYPLSCACDPAAWISAAAFTAVSYRYVMKKIEQKSRSESGFAQS